MIYHINYADDNFAESQRSNSASAEKYNVFDKVISFHPRDIDEEFFNANAEILKAPRGGGYWLWKPYFVLRMLEQMQDGDILVYTDAGAEFINSPKYLIDLLDKANQDVIGFQLQFIEKVYTKRDVFILMDCDSKEYYDSKQNLGGFLVVRKTAKSLEFFREYLKFACDERIITDSPSCLGSPDYPGFIENRHDQSVFSLLYKKYKFEAFRDPSQFGNDFVDLYPNSTYPQIFDLHRKRKKDFGYWMNKLFVSAPKKIKKKLFGK